MEFKKLKRITSHAGYARFLQEVQGAEHNEYAPAGYIPRVMSIPSPYASSPTDNVWTWNGKNIIIRETSHKVYEVFEVPAGVVIHKNLDELEAILFPRAQ